jgi:hypothetical protein
MSENKILILYDFIPKISIALIDEYFETKKKKKKG